MKYTVHTKTRLPGMRPETSVVREHEEFLWLHSVLDENESYAGFIVSWTLNSKQVKHTYFIILLVVFQDHMHDDVFECPDYCFFRFLQHLLIQILTHLVRNCRNLGKEKQR